MSAGRQLDPARRWRRLLPSRPRLMDPSTLDRSMMQDLTMRRAAFEPVMMCQQFGNGQRVIWYEYKFRGLQ